MTDHHPFRHLAKHLFDPFCAVLEARAVETIAAYAKLGPTVGTGIDRSRFWQSAVEGGVEDGKLGDFWEQLFQNFDVDKLRNIVQRRQDGKATDLLC